MGGSGASGEGGEVGPGMGGSRVPSGLEGRGGMG